MTTYKRFIPTLYLKDGLLVRSQKFSTFQAIGDPTPTIKRLTDWNVDELVLLNISNSTILDSRRSDKWHNIGSSNFSKLVSIISKFSMMPLSVGGGIRDIEYIDELFLSGADKVVLNTSLIEDPSLVKSAVDKYGSQAVVASIDFKQLSDNTLVSFINNGTTSTGLSISESVKNALDLNVGEILFNSIDHDGSGLGYHPLLLEHLASSNIPVPVIINGGAVNIDHFKTALDLGTVDAVAAGNIFYFTELSYPRLKTSIAQSSTSNNYRLRIGQLKSSYLKREPTYQKDKVLALFDKEKKSFDPALYSQSPRDIHTCTRCLYPSLSASPMQFDSDGVCMGCRMSDVKLSFDKLEYSRRKEILLDDINQTLASRADLNNTSGYDCIVSVSGGKDSYYQTHFVINELKLKPLLVTYNGNNYTDVGWKNLMNMRHVFDCDHLIVSPSVTTLKKLNKLAFIAMGDMNWHPCWYLYNCPPNCSSAKHTIYILG